LKEIKKVFGNIPNKPKSPKLPVKERQTMPKILLKKKKTDQSHLILGFRSYDIFYPGNPALALLSVVLGAGMSSRLFQRLREELGVCYYVRSGNDAYTDHGYFEIAAGLANDRLAEVIPAVLNECKKLKDELVPHDELEKAKEYIIGNTKLNLESSDAIAMFYGSQEILKHKVNIPEEKFKKIRAVSAVDLRNLARKIFKQETLNLAMIGPSNDKKKLEKLLKI
ncbi:MAG: Peptidase M16 domain protein, partial [Candidatus Nomurabacteria bacterium GW2011_GWB1_37_5]